MRRSLLPLLAVFLAAGCATAPTPRRAAPERITIGEWSLTPEPSEAEFDAAGFHGMTVWELSRPSLAAAWRGGEVYAWAIGVGCHVRPTPLPARALSTDVIGSYQVGDAEAPWRRMRERCLYRMGTYLRQRFPALNNVDGGWGN